MSRKKHHLMNEKDFTLIKTLLNAGLSQSKTQDVTGRGLGTVHYVNISNTFDDYMRVVREHIAKYQKKTAEKVQPEKSNEPKPENTEPRIEYKILNRLDTIIKIMEQLTGNRNIVW